MVKKLPNIITVIRLILIPLFVLTFYSDIENRKTVYSLIFALSGLSDVLDGYIARKFNCESKFGKLMDPFADKMMQICVAGCVASVEKQLIWVPIFLAVKELFMICGAAGLLKQKNIVVQSNWAGKLATVIYFIAFMALLIFDNVIKPEITQLLCGAFAVFSVMALLIYIRKYLKMYNEQKTKNMTV